MGPGPHPQSHRGTRKVPLQRPATVCSWLFTFPWPAGPWATVPFSDTARPITNRAEAVKRYKPWGVPRGPAVADTLAWVSFPRLKQSYFLSPLRQAGQSSLPVAKAHGPQGGSCLHTASPARGCPSSGKRQAHVGQSPAS